MKNKLWIILLIFGVVLIAIGFTTNVFLNGNNQSSTNQDNPPIEEIDPNEEQYRLIEKNLEREELCQYMKDIYYEKNGKEIEVEYCQFIEDGETFKYEVILPSMTLDNSVVSIDRKELLSRILKEKGPIEEDSGIYMEGAEE